MKLKQKITPHLWFASEAEQAAKYYTSIFKNSAMGRISHYTEAGHEIHGQEPGTVMTVEFELEGHKFLALNGGPLFTFNESVSFLVECETQEEIDYYWNKLTEGGDTGAQQCGWLKDKFGLSWQVTPDMPQYLFDEPGSEAAQRAMNALLGMKKIVIAELEKAYKG